MLRRSSLVLLAALGLAGAACTADASEDGGRPATADASDADRQANPATGDADATIEIKLLAFQSGDVSVPTGGSVAWVWDDAPLEHDVVFDDGPASPVQAEGTWERTFDRPGTYPYVCSLHPSMTGTVTVG